MSATIDLLDKYKKACTLGSDNACAASLGVSRSAVSLWRNTKGHPEADTVERMCAATGEPVARWLPLIEAERARTPEARKAWLRLAQIAAAVAMTVGLTAHTSPAHAEGRNFAKSDHSVYYVKYEIGLSGQPQTTPQSPAFSHSPNSWPRSLDPPAWLLRSDSSRAFTCPSVVA